MCRARRFRKCVAIGMVSLFAFGCLAVSGTVASAQEGGRPATKPGAEHAILKRFAGSWDAELSFRTAPDQDPVKTRGVETIRMACGGLWLITDHKGEFAGQRFEGHGVQGYDSRKKKYVGTWVDSVTTSISRFEGTFDKATQTITYKNTSVDPASGEELVFTSKTIIQDGDHYSHVMFMKGPDGEEFESLHIKYTRRKGEGKKGADRLARVLGSWQVRVNYGEEQELDYGLRIEKVGDRLKGVLISPRSGEHELKSVTWKGGALRFVREMEDGQVEIIFEAKLTDKGLKGKLSIDGVEEFNGSWTATKKAAKKATDL